MPRTIERNIFAGVAAALVVLLVITTVALWHVSNVREARVLGLVALLGSLAFSLLLGAVWLLLRRDLRARRPVVEALRESEELNARIFEGSADAMAVLDGCGRLKSVNSAMWRWIEAVGSQPVEDMQWADTWPGELGKISAAAVETAKAGRVVEFGGRCHLGSGENRSYQVTLTPVLDPAGKAERILVASRDETAGRSGEEKFRVVFDNAPSPHFILDQDRILDCNHAAVEMMRCPTKLGIIGRNVDEFSPEHQPDGSRSAEKRAELWRLAHDVGQFRYEWQARRSTGEEFPIEVLLTPVAMDGRPVLLAVWRDLSERRYAERALHEAEQRFQAFMDHSPTPWFMKDDQGRMVFINQVMADAFEVKVADIVGKTDFDWLPVETARVVRENDRRILEQNRAVQQVEIITTGDGSTHEWLVVKFPIVLEGGRKFLGGIGVDVKRQRKAERALKQSEAVFRDLFDDAPVAYHELDTEGRVLRVNKTELSLLGYAADEMIGRPIWDFVVDSVSKDAVLAKLKTGGEVGEVFQRTYIRKDGSLIPVLIRDRLIRGASGEICGLRSTMQDMSDLVRTEESLRDAEAKYRKIFENATEGIFQIDPNGRYLDANPALASILGYSSAKELLETVTDVGCQVYVDPARHGEFCAAMERDGSLTDFQSQVCRKDGSVIWVSEHAMAVRDREGRILYYEGAMEDIVARRQAESAMAEARDAAIESARLKTEFLANMSHEIRTPMNGIIGMTGLLLDTELSQRQRDFAETIADSSEALLKIINDVLDFSKIEAGMLTFEEIDFELSEVLEGVLDLFSGRALSKGVELSLIVSQDVPEYLSGDPGRLRQVLTNLVGNALKFTDKGEVRISVKLTAGSAGGKRLRFEIADTGIGISPDQQERLFQAFVQADGSTTRRYGGTGLGLAISRRLVSGMAGEIGVESVSGAGSVFWFTAVFGEQTRLPERRIPCFEGMRFLIMDDSSTTRAALLHSIPKSGASLVEASDAEEALRLLSDSASAGKPFNVAFLDADVRCPGGESVVRAIRADSRFADLKLVRVVSLNFSEEPEPGDEVAWDGHVTKPL
ncbi:MAG: PAS domain S-box protein, partial [Chthoniobacteraceae bacterium]